MLGASKLMAEKQRKRNIKMGRRISGRKIRKNTTILDVEFQSQFHLVAGEEKLL